MGLLLSLFILVIVFGLLYWLVTLLPIPEPAKKIALAILIVFCVIYLLSFLFGLAPGLPVLHYRY